MKKWSFFLSLILIQVSLYSQVTLFSRDFNDPAHAFDDFLLVNRDQGTPMVVNYAALADSAWVVRELFQSGNYVALGTSRYEGGVFADDWMITPAVRLGKASRLSWKGLSLSAGPFESYEVYISTSGQSVNGCLLNFPVLTVENEAYGPLQEHELDLAGLGFADQIVNIGFRLNTPVAGNALVLDDIGVTDDSITELVSLTFTVDMSKYIADSLFIPATDTVDIAGNFNDWDGTRNIMAVVPDTDSSKYTITIPGFRDGDYLEFKFRINSSWNDTALEFPYGGPNRTWTVTNGLYTFTSYYNEQGTISGMGEGVKPLAMVALFPNPVIDRLNITVSRTIRELKVLNTRGEMVLNKRITDRDWKEDLSFLSSGLYLFCFYDQDGLVATRKVLKQ